MKVLQINIFGNLSTGRIATDLYRSLVDSGYDGKVAYARNTIAEDVPSIKIGNKLNVYIDGVLTRLTDRAGFYSSRATKRLIMEIEKYDPDIIHLHNLHGYYINVEILFRYLKQKKKSVVWTLHDCWAFTGHCCYYSMYNAILVILCSGLVLFNIPIAKILFAKDFFVAWKYSSVLLVSIVFSALSGFLGSIFTAVKDSKIFAVSTVISAIVNCILNAILIPMWGIQGAAIATAISFFLIWFIRLICTRKYIKWRINLVVDIVAYVILVIQVVLEHFENHNYVGQIICLIILLLLYRKQFLSSMTLIINKFTKRRV